MFLPELSAAEISARSKIIWKEMANYAAKIGHRIGPLSLWESACRKGIGSSHQSSRCMWFQDFAWLPTAKADVFKPKLREPLHKPSLPAFLVNRIASCRSYLPKTPGSNMLELNLPRTSIKELQKPRQYPCSLKRLWMYHF